MATNNQKLSLTGTYSSPSNAPFTTTHDLQAPASGTVNPTVADKTKYLSDLRKATAAMQDQINKELTQRMEEDKAREAGKNGKVAADDAKEEENYGEEVQEED
ncbi:gon7 family protein [Diaporthe amygdali]|uniref:gon7 family protein n=1 Tax=Phomopsis amygdali TaxID=1214568 RepID=UPI0022FE9591|nr:gon7 family protein [Diaporthe amygdali]KAJ0125395.1 gon7 family protein [Diaporthe amygdali]